MGSSLVNFRSGKGFALVGSAGKKKRGGRGSEMKEHMGKELLP